MKELNEYSSFDKACQLKLRGLAKVLHRLGLYKQKIALNQWYCNALKPLPSIRQNNDIAIVLDCNQLQAKVFYAWRNYLLKKLDRYHLKTNAVESAWNILHRSANVELKRAITIWKEKVRFDNSKVKAAMVLTKKRSKIT